MSMQTAEINQPKTHHILSLREYSTTLENIPLKDLAQALMHKDGGHDMQLQAATIIITQLQSPSRLKEFYEHGTIQGLSQKTLTLFDSFPLLVERLKTIFNPYDIIEPEYLKHTADVYSADISPDGSTIASGSDDGTVHVWSQNPQKKWGSQV